LLTGCGRSASDVPYACHFIVLMTLLQDSTLNVVKDTHVPLLLVNNDKGELGKIIEEEITRTGIFDVPVL
jgi:hypothetical protein